MTEIEKVFIFKKGEIWSLIFIRHILDYIVKITHDNWWNVRPEDLDEVIISRDVKIKITIRME